MKNIIKNKYFVFVFSLIIILFLLLIELTSFNKLFLSIKKNDFNEIEIDQYKKNPSVNNVVTSADQDIINKAIEIYDNSTTKTELKKVIELLKPISRNNDTALFYIGFSYYYLEEYNNAIEYFLECVEDKDCSTGLGYTYFILNKYETAIKYFENNIDYKNIDDVYFLAESYYQNKQLDKSFKTFLICAELGDAWCQNTVGHMYNNGRGTKMNNKLAFFWYSKSAEQNIIAEPVVSLASMYLDGEYVNQSYEKAFELYEKAALKETPTANYGLGLLYEKGQGTAYNYKKAKNYYLLAFEQGHELAMERIDALEGDQNKALKLAEIHHTGTFEGIDYIDMGIPIQIDESLFWYKIAGYLGFGDTVSFNKVLSIASEKDLKEASQNFEIWKKNSGFDYDTETLSQITPYYLKHEGTGFYINSQYLLTNRHVSHIDETSFKKCDKITGYNPETGIFEVYENVQTQYLPKIEDVDLLKSNQTNNYSTLISNEDVFMGDDVLVLGYPKGKDFSKSPKMSKGIVNSEIGYNNNPNEFISDAVSYGGSSGSPVYSTSGNLVGILWGGDEQYVLGKEGLIGVTADPNISFVLKSSYIKKFLDLNGIEYKTATNDKELKNKDIGIKERNKIRLLECYAKEDK